MTLSVNYLQDHLGNLAKSNCVIGRASYPQKLAFNQLERGRDWAERKIWQSLWLPTYVADPSSRLSCAVTPMQLNEFACLHGSY